jgi:hypothetical protein
MTRTIFGRRQAVLRQRARQEAWRLALREEIETRRGGEPVLEREPAEARAAVTVTVGAAACKTRP